VNVQHHGTDSSLWEGKEGHPWDIIRSQKIERSATLNRFKDVPFVLDQLPAYFKENDMNADLSALGMSGHSFGALTTQVMGGMLFPDADGILQKFRDDRFTAGILYSPGPIAHLGVDAPEDIYGAIDIPLFHMTGTQDASPVENWDYTKRLVVYENSNRAEKHLLVIKDGDHMVFNGSRGKLGANPNKDKHEGIIKIAALAYWDMMLKKDEAANKWFTGSGLKNWLGDEGEFS
jgi:pimeloyl-ACP methyl ester carboxylesterase